ncbi:hypothetical protein J1N51_07625 [Psychrosphaera ytuae]|uniref:Uncharacterized protein n=1 Tax=Psychrosphaera ytuae TaxID=2820710 RepID=A0A975HH41_9GAMM|nr:hypothetical protein [Psychrosphaera ytuae]QTH62652.1 hypothetical protein J1N51_07625 [Psychrosphaera ytuae]
MFKRIVLLSFFCSFGLSANAQYECPVSGIWDHSSKPAQLFFDSNKAEISVHSHANNADAVGSVVIKDIKIDKAQHNWSAKMYSAVENSYVTVQVRPKGCNQLSVYFQGEEVLKLLR